MIIDARALAAANAAEKIIKTLALYEQSGINFRAESTGFKVLGEGAYGSALLLPDGNVLKMCRKRDDGYPVYALWASRNPGPGIPDIYWCQRVADDLFFAAMPRYQELSRDDGDRVAELRDRGLKEGATTKSYLGRAVASVVEALGQYCYKDMHTGNFLYCPTTGEYKLTDPFSALHGEQGAIEALITGRAVPSMPQIVQQQALPLSMVALQVIFRHNNREIPAMLQRELDAIAGGEERIDANVKMLYADAGNSSWHHSVDYREDIAEYPPEEYPGWDFYVKVIQFS